MKHIQDICSSGTIYFFPLKCSTFVTEFCLIVFPGLIHQHCFWATFSSSSALAVPLQYFWAMPSSEMYFSYTTTPNTKGNTEQHREQDQIMSGNTSSQFESRRKQCGHLAAHCTVTLCSNTMAHMRLFIQLLVNFWLHPSLLSSGPATFTSVIPLCFPKLVVLLFVPVLRASGIIHKEKGVLLHALVIIASELFCHKQVIPYKRMRALQMQQTQMLPLQKSFPLCP